MANQYNTKLPKDELIRLYVDEKWEIPNIAKTYRIPSNSIWKRLRNYGVLRRKGASHRTPDLRQKVFRDALVIDKIKLDVNNSYRKSKDTYWLCKCLLCNSEFKAKTWELTAGIKTSCGCWKKTRGNKHRCWKGFGEISGYFWGKAKQHAKKRSIDFLINIEYAWNLFLKQNRKCALSGLDLKFAESTLELGNASLDRRDSSGDYTEENVQWLHKDVNRMKWEFTTERLLELCKLILENNGYEVINNSTVSQAA